MRMLTGALVLPFSGPLTQRGRENLAAFRAASPATVILVVEIAGAIFPEPELCDRCISLPLTASHMDTAAAIGMQLCLNEGQAAVGVLSGIDAEQLSAAARCLDSLLLNRADVIMVQARDGVPEQIFASAQAAFACSFWGAMGGRLGEIRREVLAKICEMNRLRLCLHSGEGDELRAPMPSISGAALLLRHANELFRLIGVKIGELSPPRSAPVRKVAVVTPYYREPDAELVRCLASVREQSHQADHIMVSDGFPHDIVRRAGVHHIELGVAHADNGNTPRYVGGLVALALGYDGIAYLDADNWFERNHIKRLVETQHQTGANAVCSLRNIYLPDGTKLKNMDPEDVKRLHVDTSCYLLTRDCEFIAHLWGQMPRSWGPVCDRVAYSALLDCRLAWTGNRTLNFKSNYAFHFRMAGKPVPEKIHDVPVALWKGFAAPDQHFRSTSISRTARLFSIVTPSKRKSSRGLAG